VNNRSWYEAEAGAGDQGGAGGQSTVAGGGGQDTTAGGGGQDTSPGGSGQDSGQRWPDNWRQNLAKGDEKVLGRLQRFAAPDDVWTSYRALEQRISSGELKPVVPYPEKGTAEQQAEWRKLNGLPDKPEAYDTNLGDGVVIGEEDKPVVDSFLKFAHGKHIPPAVVKDTLKWYLSEYRTETEQKKAETFKTLQKDTEDALRADWGGDYRGNRGAIDQMLDGRVPADSDLKELIIRAVDTNAEFAKLLAGLALEINPAATLVSATGSDQSKTVDEEISKIEKFMRDDRRAYNKDEKAQARLRTLYEARERMKSRQAA
jgi:hypothetical protein